MYSPAACINVPGPLIEILIAGGTTSQERLVMKGTSQATEGLES